ncbi:hypothetical protein SPRG_03478 [Saprolegnia parasitica CBS 223.65]|uniref:Phosphatidylserine synthase n=1 Tax=Saprolegnia parasitica (strain CBS 223.65) TaxID=695850 RepID=A0A067CLH3_SAPPC|nr:hypothetical protein SPRG_03478 [Saprolegnia parasitica CBS 223.65]KDO31549.1 hypothetical protein SPRG_03478 [Saprolegnia parasitica CBS 223.65]|eukprot:XP_012197456.1 hypothetical protein SPRG_03478 [Saprolegnia parasitica CBS 223.65]
MASTMPKRVRKSSDVAVYGEYADSVPEMDDWTTAPHTLTVGFITLIFFLYNIFQDNDPNASALDDLKRGIYFACLFFLVYCVLQLRDGHFLRPHPAIWRLITGIFILYEMLLIVLLFLKTDDARAFMKHFDPKLGVKLPETGYADDCRLYVPEAEDPFKNLRATIMDRFVVMHFLGWVVGALMIRSYNVCWAISILFEFYELTFAHWLKNFNECWWDQVFLDVLLCNAAGIWIGMRICRFFEMKNYNWVGIRTIPTVSGKAQRMMAQFTPVTWLSYDWKMFRSASRFWQVMGMVITLSVMMLNSFFLKTVLWVPASSYLNVVRLSIWYSAGSYAIAEYYIFMTYSGPDVVTPAKKLGPRAWLGFGVVISEVCLILKHGTGMFTEPFPTTVKIAWLVAGLLLTVGSTIYFVCVHRARDAAKKQQ